MTRPARGTGNDRRSRSGAGLHVARELRRRIRRLGRGGSGGPIRRRRPRGRPERHRLRPDGARAGSGSSGSCFRGRRIEASKGTYDWAATDQVIADLASARPRAAGHGRSGRPASTPKVPTDPPTTSEDTLDAWSRLPRGGRRALRRRTAISGTTSPRPTPTSSRSRSATGRSGTSRTPRSSGRRSRTPAAYAELLKRSAKALHKADPEARIMIGGMFATPQSDGAIVSYDFIDQLYAQDGVADAIDIVGVHPYGPDVERVTDQLDGPARRSTRPASDASIWVTEIGWGSDPDGHERSGQDARAAGEPARARRFAKLLRRSATNLVARGRALVHVARLGRATVGAVRLVRQSPASSTPTATRSRPGSAFTELTGGTPERLGALGATDAGSFSDRRPSPAGSRPCRPPSAVPRPSSSRTSSSLR